jgi:hypothetical protein
LVPILDGGQYDATLDSMAAAATIRATPGYMRQRVAVEVRPALAAPISAALIIDARRGPVALVTNPGQNC